MPNPVVHWQILTRQVDRLAAFYSALFGWKFSAENALGYRQQASTGSSEGVTGGLWPIAPEQHAMVQLFVKVSDVGAFVAQAERLGARIVIPAQLLPGGDEMAVAVDPDGIAFAMFRGSGNIPV